MSVQENLIKVFEYALNQEKTGMSFFESSIDRMGIGEAKSAFRTLIGEEEKHIRFISGVLDKLKGGGEIDGEQVKAVTIEPTNYFDQRSKAEFIEQCIQGSMIPDVTVFNVAWLIEKDLSEFYKNAAGQTEGEASKAFRMLSEWEETHERFFKQFRDRLTATYSNMPWGG